MEKNFNDIEKLVESRQNIEKILKKDQRSYVYVFNYQGEKLVYKEPIEKNKRKWQRFISIFRGQESKREYFQMKKINSLGLLTAKPLYFKKNYLVYEYIEGRTPSSEDSKLLSEELRKIHSLGYLHGDSHFENFIIDDEDKVYIIDSKFQKNKYLKFGEIFEFMYLEKSIGKELLYDKESVYFKGALLLRKYLTFFSKLKNIVRGKRF